MLYLVHVRKVEGFEVYALLEGPEDLDTERAGDELEALYKLMSRDYRPEPQKVLERWLETSPGLKPVPFASITWDAKINI